MANYDPLSFQTLTDNSGAPAASAKIYYYATGTTSQQTVYSDAGLTSALSQPVRASTLGVVPIVYLPQKRFKRIVTTGADVTLSGYFADPIDALKSRIYADSAPSPTAPGDEWVDTTTNTLYERDSTNTSWVNRGDVDTQNALTERVNAQGSTSYTITTGDRGKLLTFSSATAVAVTLPQASAGTFPDGWYFRVKNKGAGAVTITPSSSTIGGGTALVLQQGDEAGVNSDGTNYQATGGGAIAGAQVSTRVGYVGLPQVDGNSALAIGLAHMGRSIFHDEASARVYTIPANASVPFPIGAAFVIDNNNGAGTITLSITTDTLRRADGVAGTGSRTIAANSRVFVEKTKATEWMISGAFT